ncbi:MAG: hypothetical protein CMK59_06475 [Proteobacteria bacterium]|nr:hypothetical protein [Pseudomonadota bacterium]
MNFLFILTLGCNDSKNKEPVDDNSGGSLEPASEPGAEPGAEPSSEPTSEPTSEPGGDSTGAPEQHVCGPHPNDQAAQIAIDVFEQLLLVEDQQCFLEQVDIDSNGDGHSDALEQYSAPTDLICDDANNCEQQLPSFALAWSQRHEYDYGLFGRHGSLYEGRIEGARLVTEGVETLELNLMLQVTGSMADRRIERIYNQYGNMLEEVYYFNEERWFEVTNQWDNGLLVEQELVDLINANGGTTLLSWSYDEQGRMLTSSLTNPNGQINTAGFVYDGDRLSEVTRVLDGELWLTQNWIYDGEDLISRVNVFSADYSWHTSPDTFNPISPMDYYSHWDHSLFMEDNGCTQPPLSLVYGYPDEEGIYQLGWSRADVPDRIGFAYGYSGYGWNYGDLAWFGHGGISGGYAFLGEEGSQTTVTMNYQDGVMTEELIEIVDDGAVVVNVERIRQVEDGLIASDVVTTTTTTEGGVMTDVSSLNFTYDASGRLTHRDLYENELYVHQSTWSYDDNGHLIEHGIWGTGMLFNDPVDEDSLDTELPHLSTYRQNITDEAQVFERVREQRDRDSTEWVYVDSYQKGAHSLGEYEAWDDDVVVFDAEGLVVMMGYGMPENLDYYNTWTKGPQDLLSVWETGELELTTTRTYTHTCSE